MLDLVFIVYVLEIWVQSSIKIENLLFLPQWDWIHDGVFTIKILNKIFDK